MPNSGIIARTWRAGMDDFYRIKRLPPYVFAIVNDLKTKARARGEDIIDLGMGNPDMPTPKHIVAKLVQAAQNPKNHRYSASRGITRLRKAMATWYRDRYEVELDPDGEVIATIGAKEGMAHLALAVLQPGDGVLVPNPTYPIHAYSVVIADGDVRGPRLLRARRRLRARAPVDGRARLRVRGLHVRRLSAAVVPRGAGREGGGCRDLLDVEV